MRLNEMWDSYKHLILVKRGFSQGHSHPVIQNVRLCINPEATRGNTEPLPLVLRPLFSWWLCPWWAEQELLQSGFWKVTVNLLYSYPVSAYQGLPPRFAANNCVMLFSHQHPSANHMHDCLNQAERSKLLFPARKHTTTVFKWWLICSSADALWHQL